MKTQEIRKSLPLMIPALILLILSVVVLRTTETVLVGEEPCPFLADDGTGSDPDFG